MPITVIKIVRYDNSPATERILRHIKAKNIAEFSKRLAQRWLGNVLRNDLECALG
jgi:hypothetical protein